MLLLMVMWNIADKTTHCKTVEWSWTNHMLMQIISKDVLQQVATNIVCLKSVTPIHLIDYMVYIWLFRAGLISINFLTNTKIYNVATKKGGKWWSDQHLQTSGSTMYKFKFDYIYLNKQSLGGTPWVSLTYFPNSTLSKTLCKLKAEI